MTVNDAIINGESINEELDVKTEIKIDSVVIDSSETTVTEETEEEQEAEVVVEET